MDNCLEDLGTTEYTEYTEDGGVWDLPFVGSSCSSDAVPR
jgi:hypothetical protein